MFKALFLTIALLLYQYRKVILGLMVVGLIAWGIIERQSILLIFHK